MSAGSATVGRFGFATMPSFGVSGHCAAPCNGATQLIASAAMAELIHLPGFIPMKARRFLSITPLSNGGSRFQRLIKGPDHRCDSFEQTSISFGKKSLQEAT